MKTKLNIYLNPFQKIAGYKSLLWGVAILILSVIAAWQSGFHYHGLLHFGPAPANGLWYNAAEVIIVWLIPSILFYAGGLLLSNSKIRIVDVFGTVAFAQSPLLLMDLANMLPPIQRIKNMDTSLSPLEMLQQPEIHPHGLYP